MRELRKGGGRRVCRNCLRRAGRAFHSAGHRAHRAHPLRRIHVLRARRARDMGPSRDARRQGLSPAALGVSDRPRPQRGHHAALCRRRQCPRRAHAQRRRRVDRQRPEPQRRRVPQRRTDHRADAGVQRRHSPLLDAHAQVRRHERRAPRRAGAAPHDRRTEGLRRRHAVFPDGVSAAAGAGVRVLGRQRAPAGHPDGLHCTRAHAVVLLRAHAHDGPLGL